MARQTAIVTGGSGGIGAATCHALARQGLHVYVGYAGNGERAETVARAIGDNAEALHVDVTDDDSVTNAVATATANGDALQVVVNNGGVADDDLLLRLSIDRLLATLEVNLAGAFRLSKAALRPMLKARRGRIINVSSIVGLRGNVGQTAYAASKAGLVGFTKSLAREVGRKGITVNVVAPGFVATAMTDGLADDITQTMIDQAPIGRAVSAEEVAAAIAFLASDDAAAITGAVLPVDGGAGM